MKNFIVLVIIMLAVVVVVIAAKDMIIKVVIEKGVEMTTGLPLHIKGLRSARLKLLWILMVSG